MTVLGKCRFFLHVSSGLIIYHPIANVVNRRTFSTKFAELIEKSAGNFFVDAEVQSVDENQHVLDEMQHFDEIVKYSIYLHPSNPANRDVWRATDEALKERNIVKYREEAEAKPDTNGLQIKDAPDIRSKIQMAEDGYGIATIKGKIDGKDKQISTKDNPMSTKAPGDDHKPESILRSMLDFIEGIFRRLL